VIDLLSIFDHCVDFHAEDDFEAFARSAPARWVVYLMAGEGDEPIQLLCVRNLRASLKRRLSGVEPEQAPTKRVDYRQIVRRVFWRRVDSALEADLVYLEAARALFPSSYQGMVGFRPAWFVHVDPAAEFPRYMKTIDLRPRPGTLIGPVEDKHAAQRLIELAESAFDLCRYYNVLTEAPHGRACAYKEMGKCPAPCDGSIGMDQYRAAVSASAQALVDPAPAMAEQDRQMRRLAAEMEFEQARRAKDRLDALSRLGKGPFRHLRSLDEFVHVSLQHGPRAGTAKLLLILPGQIEPVACLLCDPSQPADLLRHILEMAGQSRSANVDQAGAERLAVVAHHLFLARKQHGAFIAICDLTDRTLQKAWRDLQKQKSTEDTEAEGLSKELNAL
jgi:hypothetical protein